MLWGLWFRGLAVLEARERAHEFLFREWVCVDRCWRKNRSSAQRGEISIVPHVFLKVFGQDFRLIGLTGHLSIRLTYSLSSRDVILTQMFEGGPLFRGGALAVLEKVIT